MDIEIELDNLKENKESNNITILPHHHDFLDEVSKDDSTRAKSHRLKQYIVKNIIQPDYVKELNHSIKWKNTWRKMSIGFYWVSNICLLLATISAFLQGYFADHLWISICVGVGNILVFLLTKFSEIAMKESHTCSSNENKYLQSLGIEGIPELEGETNFNQSIKYDKNIVDKK